MSIRNYGSSLVARIGRPSAGMIVATIALALSVTGNAAAAIIISSNSQVAQNTISGHHPPSGKHANLIAGSVTGADVQDGSIGGADLKNESLTGADIKDSSIGNADLGVDSVQAIQIADNTIDGGEIIDNSLTAADLAPNSVGSSELAANSVDSSKVANKSLTISDIAGAAVSASISLSGIPDGRCTQVTFGVSGAQVGDSPIVTTGAAIQNGIVLYPNRVASAGHVEVNACNFSGTSMTAISDFPVRVITVR